MNLLVIAPAVLPTEEEALRKLRLFLRSCERFAIKPNLYGIGTKNFPGYQRLKVDIPLEYLESKIGYTHVLYTDSWDALFTGPLEEIMAKYELMGSPEILVSAHDQLGNCSNELERYPGIFDHSVYYRYPNVGGYMGEIKPIIAALRRMKAEKSQYNDDSFAWYDGIQEGWFTPMLDSNCEIFQVRSEENLSLVDGPRIVNNITGSRPCILHLAGGYASQETGKIDHMMPWAQKLGLA